MIPDKVFNILDDLEKRGHWPNGKRYLWTDAFGVILLTGLYHKTGNLKYLRKALEVEKDVNAKLGLPVGFKIGENKKGQYYHYNMMWAFALSCLGKYLPRFRKNAVKLLTNMHPYFINPGHGIWWKMKEDLSRPSPGVGTGSLDPFLGYVVYKHVSNGSELKNEIMDLYEIIESHYRQFHVSQDLALGMVLWITHFYPDEQWSLLLKERALNQLEELWNDHGYFCRHPGLNHVHYAFTNWGICLGLKVHGIFPERVAKVHYFFNSRRPIDPFINDPITHIMEACALYPGFFKLDFHEHINKNFPPHIGSQDILYGDYRNIAF